MLQSIVNEENNRTIVCPKSRCGKNVFTCHTLKQLLDCQYLSIVGKIFLSKISISKVAFLLLNPKRMKNVHLCPKGPAFSKISEMRSLFTNCECITISMLLCLKSELQVKERDLVDCLGGNNE